MKHILRTTLFVCAAMFAANAFGWNRLGHETIAVLAERHLTPAAKEQCQTILGGSLRDNAMWLEPLFRQEETKHTAAWQYVVLDANLRSEASKRDGVSALEHCKEILQNRAEHSDSTVVAALRTTIHLMGDIHNIAHVRIANIPQSKKSFTFYISNGRKGKQFAKSKMTWRRFWDSSLINRHRVFTPELYAEDVDLCHGSRRSEYQKGSLRDWAYDMGRECKPLYDWAVPEFLMSREQSNLMELPQDRCLARAGYRLAALLNEVFK